MSAVAFAAIFCFGIAASEDIARQAGQAREANRIEEAIGLYREAVAKDPKWTEGWWYLGTLLYDRDHYADAATAFKEAAALDPRSGTTLVMLGLCEADLERTREALQHLEQGRKLGIADNPQLRHVVLFRLGTLWVARGNARGDFENAQDVLDELAKDGVESEELTVALGRAVLRARPPEGNADLLRAAGHAEWLAAQRGKTAEAMVEYRRLAADAPHVPNVQFAYGTFLLVNNYNDEAISAFQREIENTPGHLLARLGIAGLKIASDPTGAVRYAGEAVKLAPDLPEGHYLLGVALLDTGKVAQSVAELELAQRQAPREAKIPFALARAYARAQRPADAAQARADFSRLNQQAEAGGP